MTPLKKLCIVQGRVETGEIVGLVSGSSLLSAIFTHTIPKLLEYWSGKQNNLLSTKQDLTSVNIAIANQQKEYEKSLKTIKDNFDTAIDSVKTIFKNAIDNLEDKNKIKFDGIKEKLDDYKEDYDELDKFLRETLTRALETKK